MVVNLHSISIIFQPLAYFFLESSLEWLFNLLILFKLRWDLAKSKEEQGSIRRILSCPQHGPTPSRVHDPLPRKWTLHPKLLWIISSSSSSSKAVFEQPKTSSFTNFVFPLLSSSANSLFYAAAVSSRVHPLLFRAVNQWRGLNEVAFLLGLRNSMIGRWLTLGSALPLH